MLSGHREPRAAGGAGGGEERSQGVVWVGQRGVRGCPARPHLGGQPGTANAAPPCLVLLAEEGPSQVSERLGGTPGPPNFPEGTRLS